MQIKNVSQFDIFSRKHLREMMDSDDDFAAKSRCPEGEEAEEAQKLFWKKKSVQIDRPGGY